MHATVKSWGNSYAIRLTKSDLRRLGVRPGQGVRVTIEPEPVGRIDLSGMPVWEGEAVPLDEARGAYYGAPRSWET